MELLRCFHGCRSARDRRLRGAHRHGHRRGRRNIRELQLPVELEPLQGQLLFRRKECVPGVEGLEQRREHRVAPRLLTVELEQPRANAIRRCHSLPDVLDGCDCVAGTPIVVGAVSVFDLRQLGHEPREHQRLRLLERESAREQRLAIGEYVAAGPNDADGLLRRREGHGSVDRRWRRGQHVQPCDIGGE